MALPASRLWTSDGWCTAACATHGRLSRIFPDPGASSRVLPDSIEQPTAALTRTLGRRFLTVETEGVDGTCAAVPSWSKVRLSLLCMLVNRTSVVQE